MAREAIVQNLIRQLGQSQADRAARELAPGFVQVDERTAADLMRFARRVSAGVRYYDAQGARDGSWAAFFPFEPGQPDGLLRHADGAISPHLGLYMAFLELYQEPRRLINQITRQHLDFYYRRVLGFRPREAEPDRAHVLVELKKNVPPLRISPQHRLSAGKDAKGMELVYAPVRDTVLRTARVVGLRSLYANPDSRRTVRVAPVANSPDGLGGEWPSADQSWPPFGGPHLREAQIGFALAAPVLRMREGRRSVTCSITLGGVDTARVSTASLANSFDVFVTGAPGWLGPYRVSPTLSGGVMTFSFLVPEADPPVVDYDAALHGLSYGAASPVMQVVLSGAAAVGYEDLRRATVSRARITVEVSEITSLVLESDTGALDPKKAFLPFGPQPTRGSRFMVGYPEALAKKLAEVKLRVRWLGAPDNFATHYADYGQARVQDGDFTAGVSFQDAGSWRERRAGVPLFRPRDAEGWHEFLFRPGSPSVTPAAPSRGIQVHALRQAGTRWGLRAAIQEVQIYPILVSYLQSAPQPRPGFITFSLERDLLHVTYRRKSVENALVFGRSGGTLVVLKEPYTPSIGAVSFAYTARTDEVDIASPRVEEFANPDLQFFHVDAFGQMREHGHQRARLDYVAAKDVPLLPGHENEGELLVGLEGVAARDSVSLLLQFAEGTADPDLSGATVQWSALCDNYWKALGPRQLTLDTTNRFRRSGLVEVVVPAEATADNTLLPAGLLWLRAAVARDVAAACRLVAVEANAVEVEFRDGGNDPAHLQTALPPGRIAKLKTPLAGVKALGQRFPSFGGRLPEAPEALNARAAERLRHKGRFINAWDCERLVLEAFPAVHRVKCIPHAREGEWLAPGHVLVVVVPDLRHRIREEAEATEAPDPSRPPAVDPLQPKVDADTIGRITDFLRERCGMQVAPAVKNPRYQKLRLDFRVRFRPGREFNFYRGQLEREIVRFLSPWAYDPERELTFGGRVYKSVLLDFVEEREYVDYVTDFKMYSFVGEGGPGPDLAEALPLTPDAILVSDRGHTVEEAA